jgi:chemotaxis protein methyltransferase CheR
MKITLDQQNFIFKLIKKNAGINFSEDKSYLLDTKLLPLVRQHKLSSVSDLISKIQESNDQNLINELVEAMTINESSFFRDSKPFEVFNTSALPNILSSHPGKSQVRIWSAACSSGQEPYSLAINLKEKWKNSTINFEIMATDLSNQILDKAKKGIFNQFEVQRGLPITLLMKYFKQVEKDWHLCEEIKNMIKFERMNLLENIQGLGKFDVIFCRNVLLYFDSETKVRILNNISNMLNENGILFLGSSESVHGVESKFKKYDDKTSGIFAKI